MAGPFWPTLLGENKGAACEVRSVCICSLDHHSLVPSPEEQDGTGAEAEMPVKAGGDQCGQASLRRDSSEAKGQTV